MLISYQTNEHIYFYVNITFDAFFRLVRNSVTRVLAAIYSCMNTAVHLGLAVASIQSVPAGWDNDLGP